MSRPVQRFPSQLRPALIDIAVVYFAVAASAKAVLHSRPAVALAVSRASGVIMMALGGFLLLEQLHLA